MCLVLEYEHLHAFANRSGFWQVNLCNKFPQSVVDLFLATQKITTQEGLDL
jgi:hypothetical protein